MLFTPFQFSKTSKTDFKEMVGVGGEIRIWIKIKININIQKKITNQ